MGLVHGVISVHPLPDLVFLPSGFQLCNCRKEKSNRLLQVITSSSCSKPWSSLDVCLAVPLIILRNKQPRYLSDIQQQPFVGLCLRGAGEAALLGCFTHGGFGWLLLAGWRDNSAQLLAWPILQQASPDLCSCHVKGTQERLHPLQKIADVA